MKKYWLLVVVFVLVGSSVWFFNEKRYASERYDIDTYNDLVQGTISSYKVVKDYANAHRSDLLLLATQDKPVGDIKVTGVEKIPTGKEAAYRNYGVLKQSYYTALGSTALRDVTVLSLGDGTTMYLTAVWGKDGLISLDRRVAR